MEDKKYCPNIHKRRSLRLKYYDYSKEGMYFITICTKNRQCTLSRIKSVGVDAHGDPKIVLKKYGEIIDRKIKDINIYYDSVKVDEYIIMPNHIHIIIVIQKDQNNVYKTKGSPWASTPTIPKIISTLKTLITKKIGYSIFQRNYYEHIIRNEKEYLKILEYIQNNPITWEEDKFNC